jgi:hypothetical protein
MSSFKSYQRAKTKSERELNVGVYRHLLLSPDHRNIAAQINTDISNLREL